MNAAYVIIGWALVAIGAAAMVRSRRASEPTGAKNKRTAGLLLVLAGAIFFATGLVAGR